MDYLKKLFKKLAHIAKNKANKPAALMALAGVILVAGVIFGALNMNGKTKQDAAAAQPTAHHKTAQKTASSDQPAAATSSESTNDADPTATDTKKSSSATAAPKSSAASTTKKATTPTEPTVYPHADPAKIKALANQTDTYTVNPEVMSATISLIQQSCSQYLLHFDIHFASNARDTTLSAQWERVSGMYPSLPGFNTRSIYRGTTQIYGDDGSMVYAGVSDYAIRLHITSPNDAYSNIVTVPACS